MAIHEAGRTPFGRVVSALVAMKMDDGTVIWMGGDCHEFQVTIETEIDTEWSVLYGMYREPKPSTATVSVKLENYTGEWRRGVPDVPRELGAGAKEISEPSAPLLPARTAGEGTAG